MKRITVRLSMDFFTEGLLRFLQALEVSHFVKASSHWVVRDQLGSSRRCMRIEGAVAEAETAWLSKDRF